MGEERSERAVVLRLSGEIGTKARPTRLQFRRRLVRNLRDALVSSGLTPRIDASHTRILANLPEHAPAIDDPDALADHPLARVFGVQSISLAERRPVMTLPEIVRVGEELFREVVRGRRFAVRARRVGNREGVRVRPREIEVDLGTALLPVSAGVDLGQPEATVHIELTESHTLFFTERLAGPAGLPLGVEGRAIALVSGGFDSAVAAWQMLRRGVELDYAFCNLGGRAHLEGAIRVMQVLAERWSYGSRPRLHALDFEPLAAQIRERTARRYWQVILKREMLRAAERVMRERRAAAIVTGDSVGQVSSQTLQNLAVVSRATDEAILRPLVGQNKERIIELANTIGTFELSKVVGEYCAMVSGKPATAANLGAVEAEEAKLDPDRLEGVLASRSVFELRTTDLRAQGLSELEVERVPEGAVLIDLRPLAQYRSEHHPEALHLDFNQALQSFENFDRAQTYVLCCELGLLSVHLAEQMRRAGLHAFHFRGGQRALMRNRVDERVAGDVPARC